MASTDNNPPPILDPFAGGGTIPLEAQRLGLEAHASDLNPVAVLINKALIEIPPKFRGQAPVHADLRDGLVSYQGGEGLAADVKAYGQWMRDEAERRIGHLYPKVTLPDGSLTTVIAWIWARTVTRPNPACGIEMPLVRCWWLGKKKGKEAYVVPAVVPDPTHPSGQRVAIEIGHDASGPKGVDGTMSGRQGATCLACDAAVTTTNPDLLLLDGQQRLTSLTQALTGDGVVVCHENKKIVRRRFFVDINEAVGEEIDLDQAVKVLPEDGKLKENFDRDLTLDVSTVSCSCPRATSRCRCASQTRAQTGSSTTPTMTWHARSSTPPWRRSRPMACRRSSSIEVQVADTVGNAARTAWDACLTLGEYAAAVVDEGYDGGFDHYLRQSGRSTRLSPGRHTVGETKATLEQFGHQRDFPDGPGPATGHGTGDTAAHVVRHPRPEETQPW